MRDLESRFNYLQLANMSGLLVLIHVFITSSKVFPFIYSNVWRSSTSSPIVSFKLKFSLLCQHLSLSQYSLTLYNQKKVKIDEKGQKEKKSKRTDTTLENNGNTLLRCEALNDCSCVIIAKTYTKISITRSYE